MNRVIQFFRYEQCFKHYTKQIMSIRQAKIHGETIVAKPVLLLAIIDGVEASVFRNNQFAINDWLEGRYKMLMSKYANESQFEDITGIEKPFWHLESDGFWHLNYYGERQSKGHTPSKAWLKENVDYAYFDEALWILLQNKEWRLKLRDYIVEYKLTDGFWNKTDTAVNLCALAAIMLVA
jgi:putative restriction endonuclease